MIACIHGWVRQLLMALVRAYQVIVSPWFSPSCRFFPTCSDYALEALQRKSLPRALWLIVRRLVRCHPFCRGGHDPVPPDRDPAAGPSRVIVDD